MIFDCNFRDWKSGMMKFVNSMGKMLEIVEKK